MRIAGIIILIILNFLYLIPFLGFIAHPHFIGESSVAIYSFLFFIISLCVTIFKYKLNKGLKLYFILLFINIFLVLGFLFGREYLKQFVIKNIKVESFENEKIYENELYVGHKIKIKFNGLDNIKYIRYLYSDGVITKTPKIFLSLPYLYPTYYFNTYYDNNVKINNETGLITYKLYIQGLIKNDNKYCYDIGNIFNGNISYHINERWYNIKWILGEEKKDQLNYITNNWKNLELISLKEGAFFNIFFTFSGEKLLNKQLLLEPAEFQKTLKSISLCSEEDIKYSKKKLENKK